MKNCLKRKFEKPIKLVEIMSDEEKVRYLGEEIIKGNLYKSVHILSKVKYDDENSKRKYVPYIPIFEATMKNMES